MRLLTAATLVAVTMVTYAGNLLFVPKSRAVMCADKKHECPTGNTCCLLADQTYGCCPAPNAVCCLDRKYCCPAGSKCVIGRLGYCSRTNSMFPWLQHIKAKLITSKNEPKIKIDDIRAKSDANRVLAHKNEWKMEKKTETNRVLDYSAHGIIIDDISAKSDANRVLARKYKCPDGKTECGGGQTCCAGLAGDFCCELPDAVCCPDKIACCPYGYTCNPNTPGNCDNGTVVDTRKSDTILDWFNVKVPAVTSVMCPDGQSECDDNETCCPMDGGKYGCCPSADANCCSDHKHCCPAGYKCDLLKQECVGNQGNIKWLTNKHHHGLANNRPKQKETESFHELESSTTINHLPSHADIQCPGGKAACKTKQTCCKPMSGSYGCCPIEKAVCCSDGEHCCPSGSKCDVSAGKCIKGDLTVVNWLEKVPAVKTEIDCPDHMSKCKTGQTCFKLPSGNYGCCPQPNAVCCSDGKHCCPSGSKCDVSAGKCIQGDLTVVNWLEKVPAVMTGIDCPDHMSKCKTGQTCCKLPSGNYGCCPQPNAVCCSDGKHCCPEGDKCDVAEGKCIKGDLTVVDWLEKVPALKTGIKCPDGQSECKTGETCCKLPSGGYGCCPQPNAVCCSDGKHCCPEGDKCDVAEGKCIKGDLTVEDWLEKVPALKTGIKCPDGQSECKTGETCCKLPSGGYGCCPQPNAVCCSDGKHCCPEGDKCDVAEGKCIKGDLTVVDWLEKVPALKTGIKCPDGQSECKTGETCCKLPSGGYGCCPQPNAVCCSDGKHCCPEGDKCDVAEGKCIKGDLTVVDWLEKVPALKTGIKCPGGQSECKTGETCCKLPSGGYGCCPQPNAVCCSDGKHCCPEGDKCDVAEGKCIKGDLTVVDWLEKVPALKTGIKCPDGQSECKTGETCCKLPSGGYGCCPQPNAVCCSDGKHCCPEGDKCDVAEGKCIKGDLTLVDWLEKVPAVKTGIKCPDGQSECKTGETCCKLPSGGYGCCPQPNAVCCSDGKHCCPEGDTCDVAEGKCIKGDLTLVDWLEKVPAVKTGIKCPDGQSECKTGETCCKLPSGGYGCCPQPNAVCCSDGKHCCPEGDTCDVAEGKCIKGDLTLVDWLEKVPAVKTGIKCPDGQSECKTGETCCKLPSGGYGCCPQPNAVCCSDGKHCCPSGTTCDVSGGKCIHGDLTVVNWLEKVPAVKTGIDCPDHMSKCKTGQTCCKLPSGNYGCCPQPNAVCCSDGKHCCPKDTTCDLKAGTCMKGDLTVVEWMEKVPAVKTGVMCADGSECKTGQTCCKLASGHYGCCPKPNAVCCSDHTHCCPEGTSCDVSKGTCNRGDLTVVNWLVKVPAVKTGVVCPGGQSQCPTGETCCKLPSGDFGCCPIPNAVCCSDGKHCCPSGTTCDVSEGKCIQGDLTVVDWLEKVPAVKTGVTCPDGSQCKSEQTCCKLTSGSYGCCPQPNAVCCSDGKHCCPSGYTCDVSSGKCQKGDLTVVLDWLEKVPAVKTGVTCPDGSQCKSEQTCCKLTSGSYGCCPQPNAVCCSDGKHCCPSGYTCDVSSGKCQKGDLTVVLDWLEKVPAVKTGVTCPDGSQCKSEQTCCKLTSGSYGCCPQPNAVCCSDGKHCCPSGYTCDVSSGKCQKGDLTVVLDWLEKVPAVKTGVTCPDGSQCKSEQTCCKLTSGSYGCCPQPNAVCCSDGKHCCPSGYTCDVSSGKCQKGDLTVVLDWLEKVPAVKTGVTCPDGSQCKSEQTCCKLTSGSYGCCPQPNAVCCSDGKHCCPSGYTCDVSSGKCQKGDLTVVLDWLEKVPAVKTGVTCPDGSQCKSEQTCCKLTSGSYGCCPQPNAVCCSDGKHCCPSGYTCDVSSGKCQKGDLTVVLDWLEKVPAVKTGVTCPDGSQCKSEQTCCKLASGSYGCCPQPNAVCCSDGKHCCPSGYTCDVSSGKCQKGDLTVVLDWLEKVPAVKTGVTCPDGSQCKSEQTCCKLASGSYGCCPQPNAVCCSDGKHCCPSGYTCDVSSGKCQKGDLTVVLDWLEKVPAVKTGVTCPDGSQCKSEQTCCKLTSGSYGCCPQPNAVCCSDGKHCCPSGYTCDVSSGKCQKGDLTVVLDWLEKVPAVKTGVTCPDGSQCKSEQTCCKLTSGSYGCCPQPNAVCCSDGKHCCPSGYTCDVSSGKCQKGDLTVVLDWLEKVPAVKTGVTCPDGSQCKSEQTCCKLTSGSYGCCPQPNAVCCSDGKHCCPSGYTCDVSSGKCQKGDLTVVLDWLEKVPAVKTGVMCPDGSQCKSEQTCCKLTSGSYGCCPQPNAVCCSDGKHCCPSGYTCDVSSGKCQKGDLTVVLDWLEKVPAVKTGVTCPDGSQCKSEQTCCKLASGSYGCCPQPNAVCCSDGKHCCPSGYTCDVSSGKCQKGDLTVVLDWLEKVPAVKTGVTCPDGSQCKSEQTCCKLASGSYGCCPQPNAVCCSDGKHCCPSGYTCDVSSGKCQKGDLTVVLDWLEKVPAVKTGVTCPDGSQCKSEQTCCKLTSGSYGCCPQPNAVCCSDGKHCCPSGYTCDVSSGKCQKGDLTVVLDWLEKVPAVKTGVTCPDGSQCKSEQTCCKLASGSYGCCPQPNAVCCSDGKHCCPSGYTCDVSSGKCQKGDLTVVLDWLEKVPAVKTGVMCPDGSQCKSEQTCCKLTSGSYGCCPQPNAVCCSDGKHCCPSGYTCDVSSGKCQKGDLTVVLDWLEKVPAVKTGVTCPDGSQCKSEQTCCKLTSGSYGCCPQPNAVCCSDGKHCCPSGYTCDVSSGKCQKGDLTVVLDWLEKVPAVKTGVTCPDGSQCKSEQTCCKLTSGSYGCCPQPNAVCCSDGKHCCPSGYTCDVSSGKCQKGDLTVVLDWLEKVPAVKTGVMCPDGSQCKSEQTCCKLTSGSYGCCPQPNAVCCSDGKHCCPSGYTCDVSSGKCQKGDLTVVLDWLEKVPAVKTGVTCPDGSQCKSEQTCCKLTSGSYGCCPQPNAVCCSDGKHCCPSGYTCDVSSGKCQKGDLTVVLDWLEKVPAVKTGVTCPDGSQCKSEQTCCKLTSGSYGCCPQPNAVCCSDGKHCCPSGYTCDVSSGKCQKGDLTVVLDWLEKVPAVKTGVTCPDGSQCKSEQTCCKLASGSYGCCPQPNAVCCSDGKHCCPSGYTCDVSSGKCQKGDLTVVLDWLEKVPAVKTGVTCPDGSQCKSEQTCCKLASGSYGCCPQPNAVCCSDGKHCCPSGYTCDVSSGKCQKGDLTVVLDWLEKVPAVKTGVMCPDGSQCKSEQTCCKLTSGSYGCCPQPNAVCCSDGKHCCPSGYTCDVSSGKCQKGDLTVVLDWLEKVPAVKTGVTCPDGSQCKSEQTCCKLTSGSYGCCPQPNAVCCSDGKHCCPSGYKCDVASGKCKEQGKLSFVRFTKIIGDKTITADDTTIICPDETSTCKNGQTCCKQKDSRYACCPLTEAVCCDDNLHCCPHNTTCNMQKSTCDDLVHGVRRPLVSKVPAGKLPTTPCQGQQEDCATAVCCQLSTGNYSCCPYAKGVCCKNSKYCCPHGYICDEGPGICRIPYGLVNMSKPFKGKPLH